MAEAEFVETELPSPITEFAVSLASKGRNGYWASGTAVIAAPHLAITAKHVVQDHWERNQGKWPEAGEAFGDLLMFAFQVPEQGEACLWTVARIWPSPHSDVSFLKLVPSSEGAAAYQWRLPTFNALPPAVGTRVAAFGYHSSTIIAGPPVQWTHDLSNSFGCVTEIYDERRDSVRCPFPCFSTDARFDGGMSGGPVFNEAGEVCGLVCSSIPATDPQDQHTSYVTTLWPALATIIDINRDGYPQGVRYPTIELARGGQMVMRNSERIGVHWDGSERTTVWLDREAAKPSR